MGNFNDNVTHLGNVLNANVDSGYLIDRLNMLQYKNKLSRSILDQVAGAASPWYKVGRYAFSKAYRILSPK
jgi:hypothetical protein